MKNILWTIVCVALAGSALAVNTDLKTFSFSTKGVDLYADGTQVLAGEQYALVYVLGNNFEGFYTDGSLVNSTSNQFLGRFETVLDGKCSDQQIQYFPKDLIGSGGQFVVVMLDTRIPSTETTRKYGELVMGWGVAGETVGVSDVRTATSEFAPQQSLTVSGNARLPADVVAPLITGIDIKGDKVVVTVQKTSPSAYYELNATDDIKRDRKQWARSVSAQKGGASGTMELEYPMTEATKLFKVVIPTN